MTIKIKLKTEYKSLKHSNCTFELPKFTVLTGLNGSGKTHLLEALSNNQISEIWSDGKIIENVKYIQFNGLNPNIPINANEDTIKHFINQTWKEFSKLLHSSIFINNLSDKEIKQNIISRIRNDEKKQIFVEKVLNEVEKDINSITENDFFNNFEISFIGNNDFFTAQFALIFKDYHIKCEENSYSEYCKEKGEQYYLEPLSQEKFNKKYGQPPWDFVNKILVESNISYEVNNPMGTRKEASFDFKLIDREQGIEINAMDLSTGEKVLMSLALAIYNSKNISDIPELLLIDEPDAALHPSMSKRMIEVLNKNIVENANIPTIITTHSPTTIIATEGISIFEQKRGKCIPTKISKQCAVELLSEDIPFLKISTEKRRQVFVESKYDVIYYELLTNIYGKLEKFPTEPIFIPARTSSGSNSNDVKNVVNSLFSNGNEQIYGIIDWDLKSESLNRIVVLGENDRYAIENYLLDPLLMGIFFIRENKVPIKDFEHLTISAYSQVTNINKDDCQLIIDKVLYDLGLQSTKKKGYKLFNKWELQITEKFNFYQGHDLEKLYKEKYPFLGLYQKEESLKKEIIEKVINDYPSLAPRVLCEVIMKIE